MKNIHVLPTEKPSRLYYFGSSSELRLTKYPNPFRAFERSTQNIYITTSDEEIKEGDFVIEYIFDNLVFKVCSITSKNVQKSKFNSFPKKHCKKIILTTDQDLIKDGVQAIDDEFLEYFVKNPSCEFVKTEKWLDDECKVLYSRTIPKEETKQETLEEVGAYQQELFSYLHDLGIIALQSEMQEIERIVLSMQQEQDKNKFSEKDMSFLLDCKTALGLYKHLLERQNYDTDFCTKVIQKISERLKQFKNK